MKVYKAIHWTFYPNKQELVFLDNTIKQLPSRLSRCLKALLDAQGETLPYDEILQVVWGTLHKDSNTIASVISELRKFINCGDAQLKYIITVPKKGYRFNYYEEIEITTTELHNTQSDGSKVTVNPPAQIIKPSLDKALVTQESTQFLNENISRTKKGINTILLFSSYSLYF